MTLKALSLTASCMNTDGRIPASGFKIRGKNLFIYIMGPVGYETAFKLYSENIVQIKKQFPQFFINRFLDIGKNMADFDIEKTSDDVYIREMLRGGLFAALWNLCEETKTGCIVDHKKIPLNQEVVEILELFNESPYEVSSKGSFLVFSNGPIENAALIGFTDNTKTRIIIFADHKRYLTPPSRQEKDIIDRKGESDERGNFKTY